MARYGGYYGQWAPYVTVAERRRKAAKKMAALKKSGREVYPVQIEGRTIARTFWGKAWCDHLEAYSDFENRLPRGRTYVRNGSVLDLQIAPGEVTALVNGSSIYTVRIGITALPQARWKTLIQQCSGEIHSVIELLQGKISVAIMKRMTCKNQGLFPSPQQIFMQCSCPDSAVMCKHVAAVLYGVGARLDEHPEYFFQLRKVDHLELIAATVSIQTARPSKKSAKILQSSDLSGLFGIDLENQPVKKLLRKKRKAS